MSGYALAMGSCYGCQRPFTFNPHAVPSINVKGDRKPICASCVKLVNVMRKDQGLDPIVPLPDAYDPIPEEEL